MKPIPYSLFNKLKENLQTKYNEADPRLTIMFQRGARYIEQGAMMEPFTVDDTPPALGSWDLAMRRENHLTGPDYMYRAHIDDGQVYVSRADWHTLIEAMSEEPGTLEINWEDLGLIGATGATDCAIEFNGYWVRTSKDAEVCFDSPAQWTHVTTGEPYIFWVDSAGALHTQQLGESAVELVASGVTKISAIRGWKNVYRWNMDHGLIIAYIKNNAVHYRTWANQGTEETPLPPTWEAEREVTELPTPAVNVGLFRTNDYRVGILCESDGEIHWTVTDRNWAGMAIRDHTIRTRSTGLSVALLGVIYESANSPAHSVEVTGTEVSALYCPAVWPQVVDISNPGPEDAVTILIECDLELYGDLTDLEAAFTVMNGITSFDVLATEKINENTIKLTTESFESAVGDITVTYSHANGPIFAQVEGGCMMELANFGRDFTPVIAPPEGHSVNTVTVDGTLVVSFINVSHHPRYTPHTIEVTAGDILVAFIHVDDILP